MMTREELITDPEYITENIQLQLYSEILEYMKDNNLSRKDLAEKLQVTKGYVSQILKGDIDFRISTIVKLCLAIGEVPKLNLEKIRDYVRTDEIRGQVLNSHFSSPFSLFLNDQQKPSLSTVDLDSKPNIFKFTVNNNQEYIDAA